MVGRASELCNSAPAARTVSAAACLLLQGMPLAVGHKQWQQRELQKARSVSKSAAVLIVLRGPIPLHAAGGSVPAACKNTHIGTRQLVVKSGSKLEQDLSP